MYNRKTYNTKYIFAIYVELFKSLKNVEYDIEYPATNAFMMHHYLSYN